MIGSPCLKTEAVSKIMSDSKIQSKDCLLIGDSMEDINAAINNKISFVLRRHEFNSHIEIHDKTKVIKNFLYPNNQLIQKICG